MTLFYDYVVAATSKKETITSADSTDTSTKDYFEVGFDFVCDDLTESMLMKARRDFSIYKNSVQVHFYKW